MQLTRTERWILSNQYRLLELFDPDNAEEYKQARTILENGYEFHYDQMCGITEAPETMSEAECKMVHDIARMFAALRLAHKQLDNEAKTEITEDDVAFLGFSDHHEAKYMCYARYYYASGESSFPGFDRSDDCGSIAPNLDMYKRMLAVCPVSQQLRNLTEEDLRRIVAARDATEEPSGGGGPVASGTPYVSDPEQDNRPR